MGLLDCVGGRKSKEKFKESEKPISRPKGTASRSVHGISQRLSMPIFSSQSTLKNDVDFWRQRTIQFLFSPEGPEDIGILRVPLKELGYQNVTDFIAAIPQELILENEKQIPEDRIAKDFKVFWVRDGIAEPGIFRWQGVLDNVTCMGLQLDRKKAVRFGIHDGKGMFYCKPGHRAMVPAKEVIPYKKFLRRYLNLPQKNDSPPGSLRLSKKQAELEQLSVEPSAPPPSRTNSRVADKRSTGWEFASPSEKPSPEKYKELEMECINSLHLPASSTKANSSDASLRRVPSKSDETFEKVEVAASLHTSKTEDREQTDKPKLEQKPSGRQFNAKIELHAPPPPVPDSPLPDSDSEELTQDTLQLRETTNEHDDQVKEAEMVRTKERPASFGSSLTRIKLLKETPDKPIPAPRQTDASTSFPSILPPEESEDE